MLKIKLNKLKPQAEKVIAGKQAGFRAERSTTEQIFNLGILCEKCLQHQQDFYHVFIDFKEAFDRVWYAALWAITKKYDTSVSPIRVIKSLYDMATSTVLFNGSIETGSEQLLSPTGMSTLIHPLQHIAGKDHDRRLGRSR